MKWLRRKTLAEIIEAQLADARLDLLVAHRNIEDAAAIQVALSNRVERLEKELNKWKPELSSLLSVERTSRSITRLTQAVPPEDTLPPRTPPSS